MFEDYIIQHSVSRPPYSDAIFTMEDVKTINHYVTETYYRNYKMYRFVFTPRETVTLVSHYHEGADCPGAGGK